VEEVDTPSNSDIRTGELRALGLRTRALEAGAEGGEEAVVFLHGGPGSANDWDDLLPQVGVFARAVALDLPGFGEADKPADWEYSASSYAMFIAGALNELGIRRAHLVMGDIGASGLLWGASHPGAFASSVMVGAGALIGYRWHALARLARAPLVGHLMATSPSWLGFRTIMRIYNPAPQKLPNEVLQRWWRDYDRATRRAVVRFWRATPPSAFERIAPVLRRLDRPALALWGANDRFTPVEQAERQRESFPDAEVVVLEDSGHYPNLDDPSRAAEAIVPFLRHQLRCGDGGQAGKSA